jgi:hypothetical protein
MGGSVMSEDQRTDEELRGAIDVGEAARREIGRRMGLMATAIKDRIKRLLAGDAAAGFTLDDLTFSATFRCGCSHGMAYPTHIGIHGSWYCSAILRGIADRNVKHTPSHPFAFYEVKCEQQPSANGATTRPPA